MRKSMAIAMIGTVVLIATAVPVIAQVAGETDPGYGAERDDREFDAGLLGLLGLAGLLGLKRRDHEVSTTLRREDRTTQPPR